MKHLILVLSLLFASNVYGELLYHKWNSTTIGIYGSGSPDGPSIREWDNVLLDYDYTLSSPDHVSIHEVSVKKRKDACAKIWRPGCINQELMIWEHPSLKDKALVSAADDKWWVVKKDFAWIIPQRSEYTKYKINEKWEEMCRGLNDQQCEESLVWKDIYKKEIKWVDQWVWKYIKVREAETYSDADDALEKLNKVMPQDARNVFFAYDALYYQTIEKVKIEVMTKVE